jgi:hypothetical protein
MSKACKSEAMAAIHEMMEGFHEPGAIDKQTMREFDIAKTLFKVGASRQRCRRSDRPTMSQGGDPGYFPTRHAKGKGHPGAGRR